MSVKISQLDIDTLTASLIIRGLSDTLVQAVKTTAVKLCESLPTVPVLPPIRPFDSPVYTDADVPRIFMLASSKLCAISYKIAQETQTKSEFEAALEFVPQAFEESKSLALTTRVAGPINGVVEEQLAGTAAASAEQYLSNKQVTDKPTRKRSIQEG